MAQTLVSTLVDARGLSCPMPIVKAAHGFERSPAASYWSCWQPIPDL